MPGTLYDKLWDNHVVADLGGGEAILYIDRHLVHEVSSPQAFAALGAAGRRLRRPETHLAVADHAVSTRRDAGRPVDPLAAAQVGELAANAAAFDVRYLPLDGAEQGIVHVIGPELGITLPGITLVCGDSHTTTHGAFGALAFGIGASECGTVMATQCLRQTPARTMHVALTGELRPFITTKDLALAFVAKLGARGATGYAVEYGGPGIADLSMAARMTLCNMTIEAGGRVGLVAPDDVTFAFVRGRPLAPSAAQWDAAVAGWRTLKSDADATFHRQVTIDLAAVAPQVTWGTSPDDAAPITDTVPDPRNRPDPDRVSRALAYMDLVPGTRLDDCHQSGVHRLVYQRPDRGPARRRGDRPRPPG
jgi:3-isopropylmalate/(R)-2-methylmalate dehydratase large subunit